MERYKISATSFGIWHEFILKFIVGLLFIVCGLYLLIDGEAFIGIAILLVTFRLIVFRYIDLLLSKEIVRTTNSILLKAFCIKFEITNGRSFTVIEPYSFPSKYGSKYFYLVIVRNNPNALKRLFKNKIKLYPEDGKIDLVGVAKKIENEFGIPYHGIFDLSEGGNGINDASILMPNKGIVP